MSTIILVALYSMIIFCWPARYRTFVRYGPAKTWPSKLTLDLIKHGLAARALGNLREFAFPTQKSFERLRPYVSFDQVNRVGVCRSHLEIG